MANSSTALVVPTCRDQMRIDDFLIKWAVDPEHSPWGDVIIVEDQPSPTLRVSGSHLHLVSHADIAANENIPDGFKVFSREDSAIRCYGFLYAYHLGADYIFSLDDDCYPIEPENIFVTRHVNNLTKRPAWTPSITGFPTRGYPFGYVGFMSDPRVAVSMGLWNNNLDLDSVQSLMAMRFESFYGEKAAFPETSDRVYYHDCRSFVPFCGMNFAFKREFAPLMYFPPMGRDSPYRRFDDIWCGLVLQRALAHLGYNITIGGPKVNHSRASNPFVNLEKEAAGIKANEYYWKLVADIRLTAATPKQCAIEIAHGLATHPAADTYIKEQWSPGLLAWANLF